MKDFHSMHKTCRFFLEDKKSWGMMCWRCRRTAKKIMKRRALR